MLIALLQVLAVFAIVNFGTVLFRERARHPLRLAAAGLGVVFLNVVVGWPVHVAAGMLLGALFSLVFSRRADPWPGLSLLALALLFSLTGADWVLIPAAVAGGVWLLAGNGLRSVLGLVSGQRQRPFPASPGALPEHTGGLPVHQPWSAAEPVPVGSPAAKTSTAQATVAPAPDPLARLHGESRLPDDARTQLMVLDQLTAEALAAVPGGGDGLYQLRAIRNEYAPNVVAAYLRLPPTLADVTPLEGHKTGHDLLTEQLDLLITVARDLLNRSALASSQDLLSNGRFLREKFGGGPRDLEL